MGREACPLHPAAVSASAGATAGRIQGRQARCVGACETAGPPVCFPAETIWLATLAGLKHPFPSRTRPLRARAAMILRPGARESSASPTSLSQPPAHTAQGAFSRANQPMRRAERAVQNRAVQNRAVQNRALSI